MAEFLDYDRINEAVTAEAEMPIVTKWLLLFEGIDDDGDRRMGYMSSEHCAAWDELGMLAYHKAYRTSSAPDTE